MTLRGRVTRVGGIQEKLIGALRAGVKTVMLPAQNRKDVKDVPQEVKDGLEVVYVGYTFPSSYHASTFFLLIMTSQSRLGSNPTCLAQCYIPRRTAACQSRKSPIDKDGHEKRCATTNAKNAAFQDHPFQHHIAAPSAHA